MVQARGYGGPAWEQLPPQFVFRFHPKNALTSPLKMWLANCYTPLLVIGKSIVFMSVSILLVQLVGSYFIGLFACL